MDVSLSEVIISEVMHVHVLFWCLHLDRGSHLSFKGLEKLWLTGHLLVSQEADVALHQ